MADGHDRWEQLRAQLPVLRRYAYMNCGWSGPLSEAVVGAMRHRIELETWEGPVTRSAMEHQRALTARLRALTADMLHAEVDEIAITGNTTEGVNIAVNGTDLQPGDRVVTTTVEHPGGLIPAYWSRERRGAELSLVAVDPGDGHGAILERFDQAIDDHTRLVVLSEISYSTGQRLPLRQITELAHARGASVVVDGAQTAGHLPVDVRALGIDAYAIPSHKWLCGPDGLGMLFVRRDRIADFDPVKVSMRAAASYDFQGEFQPQRDLVTKFEVSTMSVPVIAGTVAALEQYLAAGVEESWERIRALARHAEARFDRVAGVEIVSPRSEESRTGLFLFRHPALDPAALVAYLHGEADAIVRPVRERQAVRLSLHVYNTEAEIDRVAEHVDRAIREGIPQRYIDLAARALGE